MSLVSRLDDLLPQTQCGECGYAGCLPYAEALAQGLAPINKCPPGGVETVKALGALLAIKPDAYLMAAVQNTRAPSQAVIREEDCIGCTKCIKACPVDAIVGSGKLMHTILSHECTGCGLCIEPCPVDCIEMVHVGSEVQYDKQKARRRFQGKKARALRLEHDQQQLYREKRQLAKNSASEKEDQQAKRHYIQQALARVKAKKHE